MRSASYFLAMKSRIIFGRIFEEGFLHTLSSCLDEVCIKPSSPAHITGSRELKLPHSVSVNSS